MKFNTTQRYESRRTEKTKRTFWASQYIVFFVGNECEEFTFVCLNSDFVSV